MAGAGEKRRVLVTGGGRGLGSAIVRALAAAGHDVTFTYRSAEAEAADILRELADACPQQAFAAHPLDLADKPALDAFAQELEADAPYSAFVHNAGQSYDTLAMMIDQGKAETAMQVNFWSFTRLVGALARPMMRARDGRIVAIGSLTALQANQGNSIYAACKAALLGYLRTLAIETARSGVTVNYIAPGFIDTDMTAELTDARRTEILANVPLKRYGSAEEIAGAALFLASDAGAYVSGAVLPVDGGLGMGI